MRHIDFGFTAGLGLAVALAASGCQNPSDAAPAAPTATAAADPNSAVPAPPLNGIGYVLFDAPINRGSADMLTRSFERLHDSGATEIDLVLNSEGGVVDAAQGVVAAMDRLHADDGVVFKVWNVRFVASAATLIFLDAQQRYAYPRGAFLFHGAKVMDVGLFDSDSLRTQAEHIDAIDHEMRNVLLARTHLTPQQADVYTSRTVILSADQALKDGVVDGIGTLQPPKEARIQVIRRKQTKPAPKPATPT